MYEPSSESNFQVEEILNDKIIEGKLFYFVKWKGFGIYQATWQPVQHLTNAPEQINLWKEKKKKLHRIDKVSKRQKSQEESFDGDKYLKKNKGETLQPKTRQTQKRESRTIVDNKTRKKTKKNPDQSSDKDGKDEDTKSCNSQTTSNRGASEKKIKQRAKNPIQSIFESIKEIKDKNQKSKLKNGNIIQSSQQLKKLKEVKHPQSIKQKKRRGRPAAKNKEKLSKQNDIQKGLQLTNNTNDVNKNGIIKSSKNKDKKGHSIDQAASSTSSNQRQTRTLQSEELNKKSVIKEVNMFSIKKKDLLKSFQNNSNENFAPKPVETSFADISPRNGHTLSSNDNSQPKCKSLFEAISSYGIKQKNKKNSKKKNNEKSGSFEGSNDNLFASKHQHKKVEKRPDLRPQIYDQLKDQKSKQFGEWKSYKKKQNNQENDVTNKYTKSHKFGQEGQQQKSFYKQHQPFNSKSNSQHHYQYNKLPDQPKQHSNNPFASQQRKSSFDYNRKNNNQTNVLEISDSNPLRFAFDGHQEPDHGQQRNEYDELQQIMLNPSKRLPNYLDVLGSKRMFNRQTNNQSQNRITLSSSVQQGGNFLKSHKKPVIQINDTSSSLAFDQRNYGNQRYDQPQKKVFLNERGQTYKPQRISGNSQNNQQQKHLSAYSDPRLPYQANLAGQKLMNFLNDHPTKWWTKDMSTYIEEIKQQARQEAQLKQMDKICRSRQYANKKNVKESNCPQSQVSNNSEIVSQSTQASKNTVLSKQKQQSDIESVNLLVVDIIDWFKEKYPEDEVTPEVKEEIQSLVQKIVFQEMSEDIIEKWLDDYGKRKRLLKLQKSKEKELLTFEKINNKKFDYITAYFDPKFNPQIDPQAKIMPINTNQQTLPSQNQKGLSPVSMRCNQDQPQKTTKSDQPNQKSQTPLNHQQQTKQLQKPHPIVSQNDIIKIVQQFKYKDQKCFKLLLNSGKVVNSFYLEVKRKCPKLLFNFYQKKLEMLEQGKFKVNEGRMN